MWESGSITAVFGLSGTVTTVTPGTYSKALMCPAIQQCSTCDSKTSAYMKLDSSVSGAFRTSPSSTTPNFSADLMLQDRVGDHQDAVPAILGHRDVFSLVLDTLLLWARSKVVSSLSAPC